MAEWARIDVNIFRHPQVSRLTQAEQVRYLQLILYAQEHETDGIVEDSCLRWCDATQRHARAMEAAGLLERDDDLGGWRIRGFLKYQRSAEEMRAEREANRERARAARERKKEAASASR